jgi:hypothetical protein
VSILTVYSVQPLHFYPMAMFTHRLVPPPTTVSSALGEERSAKRGGVSVTICDRIVGETVDGVTKPVDKKLLSGAKDRVVVAYEQLEKFHADSDAKVQNAGGCGSKGSGSGSVSTNQQPCCKGTSPASSLANDYVGETSTRSRSGG